LAADAAFLFVWTAAFRRFTCGKKTIYIWGAPDFLGGILWVGKRDQKNKN
jgi:hypothetical protein